MSDVQDEFLALLLQRESTAVTRLLRLYAPVYKALVRDAERLAVELAEANASGIGVGEGFLAKQRRILALRDQIAQLIDGFARDAEVSTRDLQGIGVDLGAGHGVTLTQTALAASAPGFEASFNRVPASALENLVGQFSDGSPLRSLFQTFGPDAAQSAEQILFRTLAQGQHPTIAARALRTQLGVPLTRAMAVARTELLRSYRSAGLAQMRSNADVVKGWRWNAKLDRRTCSACWARHNTVYPLSAPFIEHVNGRCVPSPVTMTWEELGFPPEVSQIAPPGLVGGKSGIAAFAALSETEQVAIVGPGKLALLKAGSITLADTVQETSHPRWGVMHHEASIPQALANHNQAKPWLRYDPPPQPPRGLPVIPNQDGAIRSARSILTQGPGWTYKNVALRVLQRFGVLLSLSDVRGLWNQLRRAS